MTYQVLARKWRPQDFSSIVGQEPIITALQNGLKDNRIAQAYLFSGIRGVGKTTAARVLAKALNCERAADGERASGDPCNDCLPCREITAGTDLDVQEVDAATYSKVEQVRELTESLRYGPARDRFKVVVLDEVHRLSRQAFDALLKIVEEPPAHLVFIFATTEIDAVPATILSRCQEFQFRRVPSPVLAKHLRRLSEAEQIEVSDAALRLIARAGEGSVRDSVALLDQLATFGNSSISDRDAANLLGGLDAAIFLRMLKAILEGHAMTVTETVREIEANGWDPHNVFGQFLVYTRDALHLAIGGRPDSVDLPLEEAESLADLVCSHSYENLLRLSDHLLMSEPTVRRSEFALLALELAWLRAAELPKLTRIEELLSPRRGVNGTTSGAAPATSAERVQSPSKDGTSIKSTTAKDTRPADKTAKSTRTPARDSRDQGPPPFETASATKPSAQSTPAQSAPSARSESLPDLTNQDETSILKPATGRRIDSFRDQLSSRRQPLAALVESAKLAFEDGQLLVYPQAGDSLLPNALKRKNNAALFDELLREVWGEGTTWTLQQAPNPTRSALDPRGSERKATEKANEDSMVKTVLEVFGGNVQNVQHYGKRESTP